MNSREQNFRKNERKEMSARRERKFKKKNDIVVSEDFLREIELPLSEPLRPSVYLSGFEMTGLDTFDEFECLRHELQTEFRLNSYRRYKPRRNFNIAKFGEDIDLNDYFEEDYLWDLDVPQIDVRGVKAASPEVFSIYSAPAEPQHTFFPDGRRVVWPETKPKPKVEKVVTEEPKMEVIEETPKKAKRNYNKKKKANKKKIIIEVYDENGEKKKKKKRMGNRKALADQKICCIKLCEKDVSNRLRFSLKGAPKDNSHIKPDFLAAEKDRVCNMHYFQYLYRYKKMLAAKANGGVVKSKKKKKGTKKRKKTVKKKVKKIQKVCYSTKKIDSYLQSL